MNKHHPFHPIIYVRGFAATMSEIEETVADPFMGFNIGSTKARRLDDGTLQSFYFESPLVRFFSEHHYDDVYDAGMDQIIDPRAGRSDIAYRCLVIHRYYDSSSESFGDNKMKPIEEFAIGLSRLIARVRDKVCAKKPDGTFVNDVAPEDFRVYLVAHSMGGSVCRAFLQNRDLDPERTAQCIDKMFTYATPHGGIDLRIVGNVPGWGVFGEATNFNRERMAGYLGMPGAQDVSELRGFPAEYVFNLVGTNSSDYLVAHGISRWGSRRRQRRSCAHRARDYTRIPQVIRNRPDCKYPVTACFRPSQPFWALRHCQFGGRLPKPDPLSLRAAAGGRLS